jgi:murein DD-endopeptidase MepM/ murein hydrolase activator NlpD
VLVVLFRCVLVVCAYIAVTPVDAFGVQYQAPVSGNIVDPYRPPINPYGAGNRGWEFRVEPGTEVFAPADGVVVFAGQVGGVLNVVVQHGDGVRTTLRKMTSIDVKKSDVVQAGQRIGVASGELYFGARCGDAYIDPSKLFHQYVWLVPLDGSSPAETSGSVPDICVTQTITEQNAAWLTASAVADAVTALR